MDSLVFNLNIKDKFSKELPADPVRQNTRRQVTKACFSYVVPKHTQKPMMVHVSPEMCKALGLDPQDAKSDDFLKVFTGNALLPNTEPYAMCYGGHQFGNWAGQLGDGRAINLAEVAHVGKSWALQLKGAGETPYSRTADGLAVLRSSIREYLCSEAMHHLGVPTTRALSLALTGDQVLRDVLYNGNPAYEKGAIVCRVAPSFIRFGNYEIFASRNDTDTLKTLVDFTIANHFSYLGKPSKDTYLNFFQEVVHRSLQMVVHWQRVGFVHGVMNTDNMSVLGLTIDYGPYGWLEGYDPGWTPNTTDNAHKRYRYGAQPEIVLWNLYKLANALYPLIEETEPLAAILSGYRERIDTALMAMMRAKLGLEQSHKGDTDLITSLEFLLQRSETDMTLFFRLLAHIKKGVENKAIQVVGAAFYHPNQIVGELGAEWDQWFIKYGQRLQQEPRDDYRREKAMHAVNPKYVLRNYMAQMAIDTANAGDFALIDELFTLLKKPYDAQPEYEKWFAKRPDWAKNKIGCSMLSCSS